MNNAASEHSCTCQYDIPIAFKITLDDLNFVSKYLKVFNSYVFITSKVRNYNFTYLHF